MILLSYLWIPFSSIMPWFIERPVEKGVDLLLALILTLGGVVGAQFGGRWGARLPAEQLRLLMALVVLSVAGGLLYQLVAVPRELYAVITLGGSL